MQNIRLGLKENWRQFSLLVVINGFVGGMAGLERTILPQIAEEEFAIAAKTAILSFIIVFGLVKAVSNYYAGTLANKFGRKNLLIAGWLMALPVPFILMFANNWNWIIAANIFLGVNQGLAWSSTIVMKIDLVGEKQRGFAMGLNEFAGYIAVAVVAFLTGWIAGGYGLRPYPFYLGIGLAVAGLLISLFMVKDTRYHVQKEAGSTGMPLLSNVFWNTTWKHRTLGTVTQAGLINNLNDAVMWGLLPLLLITKGFGLAQTGLIAAIYPAVWGVAQLLTGRLADLYCKRNLLYAGMLIQGLALFCFPFAVHMSQFITLATALGIGTALVYPTFLATIAENTHPVDRASSLGTFRFWRDLGYAIGALMAGILADAWGLNFSIIIIAVLTFGSGLVIYLRMKCRIVSPGSEGLAGDTAISLNEPIIHH